MREKLIEQEIAQAYIGKPCNEKRVDELFTRGAFYPANCDIKMQLKLEDYKINITFSLTWEWKQRDIEFSIHIGREDGVITDCFIRKWRSNYCGLYTRNSPTYLKPTQQELRLFMRVMEYVTTFDEEE
mgnify:CR=1 FL=1